MNVAYRKRPVVIEAVQWDGREETLALVFGLAATRPDGGFDLPGDGIHVGGGGFGYVPALGTLDIPTLEGTMTAQPGDWIIRGVKGEIYPCKPDIFAETYDPVPTRGSAAPQDPDSPAVLRAEITRLTAAHAEIDAEADRWRDRTHAAEVRLRETTNALRPFVDIVRTFEENEHGGHYGGTGIDRLSDLEWRRLRPRITTAIRAAARAALGDTRDA